MKKNIKILASVFVSFLAIHQSSLAQYYSDGSLNAAGKWLFYVGAKKHVYQVFLTQKKGELMHTYILSGYMLAPDGKRFNFYDSSLSHGTGRTAVFALILHEGESKWLGFLEPKKFPRLVVHGDVTHKQTGKYQAEFSGKKL